MIWKNGIYFTFLKTYKDAFNNARKATKTGVPNANFSTLNQSNFFFQN